MANYDYPILAQRGDCATMKLGYGSETVGSAGCLFISLLMMVCKGQQFSNSYYMSFMGCLKDPKHGNYTQSGGSMLQSFNVAACRPTTWGPCVCVNPGASVYNGVDMPSAELTALFTHLKGGNPAIIEVDDRGPSAGANHSAHQHFVLAVGATDDGQIVIHDPWHGDETTLTPRYGKTNYWAIYRAVKYNLSTNPTPPVYPTPKFAASATSITAGQSVTLSWSNTDGANEIRLNGAAQLGPAGSAVVKPTANTTYSLFVGYPDAPSVTLKVAILVTPAPVPTNTRPVIGMNVIFNGDDARNAIKYGAKFISCTFNPDLAWVLKQQYPDLIIGARGNFNMGALPGDSHFLDKVGAGIKPGVVVYGVNENNHIDDDTPEQIKKRAEFDAKWWKYCKDRGAIYAGGGFAMGRVNIMDASIRAAMRQYYAPLVNAGMWFNQHTYGGNDGSGIPLRERIFKTATWPMTLDGVTFTMRQTWWLEERWRFYCAVCGFDPTKFKFISDETGVDDNPGGFRDHNYTDAEVVAWCKRYAQITSEPVFYNGAFYPSNFIGGALFQAGDDAKWAGYECRLYWPALQAAGWGQI